MRIATSEKIPPSSMYCTPIGAPTRNILTSGRNANASRRSFDAILRRLPETIEPEGTEVDFRLLAAHELAHHDGRAGRKLQAAAEMAGGKKRVVKAGHTAQVWQAIACRGAQSGPAALQLGRCQFGHE